MRPQVVFAADSASGKGEQAKLNEKEKGKEKDKEKEKEKEKEVKVPEYRGAFGEIKKDIEPYMPLPTSPEIDQFYEDLRKVCRRMLRNKNDIDHSQLKTMY